MALLPDLLSYITKWIPRAVQLTDACLLCTPQVRSQLATSEATAASLKAELVKAEAQTRDFGSLQQALEQAEGGRRALAQNWQKEQAVLERQLQAAGRDRDQLAEQVLSSADFMASSNTALHLSVHCTRSQ